MTLDRRVRRTRQGLRDALLSLIREKGYEALSVQEIAERADVGRATFYSHFDNKEDLLFSGLDELRSTLKGIQQRALAGDGPPEARLFSFTRELFAHTDGHRDVFHAMVGDRSAALVEQAFRRLLLELVRDDVKAACAHRAGQGAPADEVVQFVAGGLFGLVLWWLEGGRRPSVDEVNAQFRSVAIPAVTPAMG